MRTDHYILNSCLLLAATFAIPLRADVIILAEDRAVIADIVRIQVDGTIKADDVSDLKLDDVLSIRFDSLPCDAGQRAWLCFRQGQRVSGRSITIGPDRLTLTTMQADAISAALGELQAVFFHADSPAIASLPETGVRVISANGDIMNAPAAELTEAGVIVDISPDVDPILLPRDRVAGVLWPAATESVKGWFVELRTGERWAGQIVSLDDKTLVLNTGNTRQTVPARDISTIQREPRRTWWADEHVPAEPASGDRPKYRIGRSALGSPLAIGTRLYAHGIGCRGPVAVDIHVPAGAKWFVTGIGVDNRAGSSARVKCTVLVNGKQASHTNDLKPGERPRRMAVFVKGADVMTLKLEPAGENPVGCLGDIVDAMFIE